jgi:hypothetical protein
MAERSQLQRLVLDLSAPGPVIPSSAVIPLDAADRGRLSGAGGFAPDLCVLPPAYSATRDIRTLALTAVSPSSNRSQAHLKPGC